MCHEWKTTDTEVAGQDEEKEIHPQEVLSLKLRIKSKVKQQQFLYITVLDEIQINNVTFIHHRTVDFSFFSSCFHAHRM